MKLLLLALLAGCSLNPMHEKRCDAIYAEPERGVEVCITRRQVEEILRSRR